MSVLAFMTYLVVEALAFYAVASWIGTGWALLALFVFFVVGDAMVIWQLRRIIDSAVRGRTTAGRAAGDVGLVMAGCIGVVVPGFVSTILGLLLIIPPTRAIVRRLLAAKLAAGLDELGTRIASKAQGTRPRQTFGSFIDETPQEQSRPHTRPSDEEITRWARDVDPDDFGNTKP